MSGATPETGSARCRLANEDGVIAIIVSLLLVVILTGTAFVFDLSRTRHSRQQLQDAVDLAAVGAAGLLPAKGASQGAAATSMATMLATANAPQLVASGGPTVTFKCIVSDPEGNGGADSPDLRYACGPAVAGTWTTGWTTKRGRATHACNPAAGDTCNAIVVGASNTVKYFFAPVIGVNEGSTGAVQAASCKGFCGQSGGPLDIALVLDRTGSMTDADIANVKNAAKEALALYDPTQQHIALLALPYGRANDPCRLESPQLYPNTWVPTWRMVPLSSDYLLPNGTLDNSSDLVSKINCIVRTGGSGNPNPTVQVNGRPSTFGGHTDLGDPMSAAGELLRTFGRADAPDVVLFMTDGEANQPDGFNPCSYAVNKAAEVKAAGAQVFTIAYGVAAAQCTRDTTGAYRGAYASRSLAAMATDSTDNLPGGCAANENTDGDNYFCESGSGDLAPVFKRVAIASIKRSRLIDVD